MLLAFGLVLFTTIAIAILAKKLLPAFSWGEAFLLGAIVSPTDASVTTSILKKLGIPRNVLSIIEGESLLNDASALMLYRFSLVAIVYGSFSLHEAIGSFLYLSIGGIIFGIVFAYLAILLFKRLNNSEAEIILTFVSAYASYLIAEHLGLSGVIATVTAGLFFGIRLPETATSKTRINAKASWDTLIFAVNAFVFTLIGFELPVVLKQLTAFSFSQLLIYGAIFSLAVMALRFIFIYPVAYISRLMMRGYAKSHPVTWQSLFVIGWAGVRGIVPLAAALAIPHAASQHASLLVFLTYFVVIVTLIVPTITLPFLIRQLGLHDPEEDRIRLKEEALARLTGLDAVQEEIESLSIKKKIPTETLNEFLSAINRMRRVIQTQLLDTPFSLLVDDYTAYKLLTLTGIEAERKKLLYLRNAGEIHDEVFWSLSDELDIEELRAKGPRL